ncbi:hypothetical protein DAPPUDRAFT_95505 [Daphnia pulex]|uniref:G-protein coupled receptors family 1 profile domain-containing protein n=1 Tax=Daphnia pulex TaxID=6669 RepID=E9FVY7_DAPPU|nr:hypothetical protein DAPPUDRAFT_95505 [Daphnia pulex]|eukprot:EFX89018.1 hypothetical protein DAPPUDRAFT_95505 [Daphnia pulex]
MEILALHFLDLEGNTHTTTPPMTHTSRKVDRSDSTSLVPGVNSDAADAFAFIYGVVGPTIVTFGLIGNILILFVVGRSRMEGAIPVYLSALALSDMGALLSSIPLWIRLAQKVACSHWNAFYYGHLELFILNTFMAASIFNVVALTVERYTSVCLAGQFPKIHTPLRAKMAVATSFLLGLIVSFPLCILKYVVNSEEEMMARNSSECRFQYLENRNVTAHPLWTAYVWMGESLVRFLPGLILVILNMLILIKYHGVVKTRRQMQRGQPNANANGNNGRSDRNLEQERKLLTLLLSIIVLFFITNIPSAVLSIIYDQELEDSHSFQVFRAVANLLEMSNFALNFCMYFLCSKEFRKMLYKAMPQCGFSKFFILSSTTSNSQSSNPQTVPNTLSGTLNNHPP